MARDFVEDFALRAYQLDPQRHLPPRVRGATQAGIIAANHRFHAVEHAGSEAAAMYEVFGHLQHAAVHGQIVVTRRDDEDGGHARKNQPVTMSF